MSEERRAELERQLNEVSRVPVHVLPDGTVAVARHFTCKETENALS